MPSRDYLERFLVDLQKRTINRVGRSMADFAYVRIFFKKDDVNEPADMNSLTRSSVDSY